MKLIDEIAELIEYQVEEGVFVEPSNSAVKEFLNFVPSDSKKLNSVKEQKTATAKPIMGKQISQVNDKGTSISDISNLSIELLQKQVLSCQKCSLHKSRINVVYGEGNPNANLMFIGEAPGRDEDILGRPFVGKSGQLLTKMIKAMGFDRPEVYIANIIKCRPPYNRNPNPDEAKYCLNYLNRQIELIKPKVIILLGAVPLQFLLGLNGITRLHGQWKDYNGIKVMPTFHPAFLLRDPRQKRPAWEDLQKVMKYIGTN
jgi:uracil-DNA glycosylase